MRNLYKILLVVSFSVFASSCFKEDNFENSKKDNFEALWKILDEQYCFFEYKDINWNDIHAKYSARISEDMTNEQLFYVLGDMLAELKDGHVNMTSKFDVARYWKWFEDYPDNFDLAIQRKYLGTGSDYYIAGGLKYRILDDNIGYIYYGSFSSGISESNIDNVLLRLADCDGIIIDIRDNGGGLLSNSEKLSARFFKQKTLVGYILHKTGKGHNDFSKPYEKYADPPNNRILYPKTSIVLTNRRCYSASNDFINTMKYAPNVTVIGDRTGGGGGLPFSSELPNGWSIRFSASPMLNAEYQHIEFGIDPDIKIDMAESDMERNIDTIIEEARNIIKNKK